MTRRRDRQRAEHVTGNRIDANDSGGILVNGRRQHDRPREHASSTTRTSASGCAFGNGTRITQNAIDDTLAGLGIDLVGGANNNQTAPA